MHQPAISHRSQHGRKRDFMPDHLGLHPTLADCNRAARTERNITESATIFRQCNLSLRTAVEIVEYGLGQAIVRDTAQIFNVDDLRRAQRTIHASHYLPRGAVAQEPAKAPASLVS